jgi:putative CocE/NonD family hydrolase
MEGQIKMNFEEELKKPYFKEITNGLEKPYYKDIKIKDFNVHMRDGCKLMCHVSFPIGDYKSLPCILMRTPYGMSSLRFFHEMSFYGYICIAQDCRGCFESEGEWVPAKHERDDGEDTLNWLKNQPWCDGNIALTGTSYLSMNQYLLADILPPEVKTLNIEVYSPYRYPLMYSGRMFHFEAYAGWLAYNSGVKGFEDKGDEAYNKMLHFSPAIRADEAVFGQKIDWYRDWITSVDHTADIWNSGAYGILPDISKKIKVPVLMHAGWYDPHFDGMFHSWENLPEATREKSLMIITPTNHKQQLCADIDTPNAFSFTGKKFIKSKLNWFGHFLKGRDFFQETPLGKIRAYVYGKNNYMDFSYPFEDNKKCTLFFDTDNKMLCKKHLNMNIIKYLYNPKFPVPTCGSEVIMTDYMYHKDKKTTEGRRLQPKPDYRKDVITFLSESFKYDVYIEKPIEIWLDVASSAKDTAFSVKISIVNENGQAYFLRQGIMTIISQNEGKNIYIPNEKITLHYKLVRVFAKIKKGMRIRADISSSDFPAFHIHPNTDNIWSREENPVTAEQVIFGGRIEF